MKNKLRTVILCVSLGLAIVGCEEKQGAMEDFKRIPTSSFNGGLKLADGRGVKYLVASDDKILKVAVEIKTQKGCIFGLGQMPVMDVGGYDGSGQHHQFSGLKAQINPKHYIPELNGVTGQFVHLVLSKDAQPAGCSSIPAVPEISSDRLQKALSQDFFSNFGLSEKHLAMAGAVLPRGSSQVMYFFKEQDLGLIFDSASMALVGISIPKHKLITNYQFTVNQKDLKTNDIESSGPYPLMMGDEDFGVYSQTTRIVRNMVAALKDAEENPQHRIQIIYGTWNELFEKYEVKK